MGRFLEDLWDHEGYGARRLPDGTLTGTWTYATREFTAFLPACGCGWHVEREYPPNEDGEQAALDQWRAEHAAPLLARQAERRRLRLARALEWLGGQAGRLEDPAIVARVRRTLGSAADLAAEVQRDLDRQAPEREATHETP
jgi:hypothetical protein